MENIIDGGVPFPYMSESTATFFVETLLSDNYEVIVEYGSGGSTLYYLENLLQGDYQGTFLSIEFDAQWYEEVINRVRNNFRTVGLHNEKQIRIPWSDAKLDKYLSFDEQSSREKWDFPESLRRLKFHGQSQLLNRISNSTLVEGYPEFLINDTRPADVTYFAQINKTINFFYQLKFEFFKDQYGESPIKNEYIEAGFRWPIIERLRNSNKDLRVAFIIDGGPRADIVERILDLENEYINFLPTIFLLEGNRRNFHSAVKRRITGRFVAGSNKTPVTNIDVYASEEPQLVNGEIDNLVLFAKQSMTWQEKSEKELWFYKREMPRQNVSSKNQNLLDETSLLFELRDFNAVVPRLKLLFELEPNVKWIGLYYLEALVRTGSLAIARELYQNVKTVFDNHPKLRAIEKLLY